MRFLACQNVDDVAALILNTLPLVKTLLDSSRPRHVTGMLASALRCRNRTPDQLAVEELGPPPDPFAFIAMGGQGGRSKPADGPG